MDAMLLESVSSVVGGVVVDESSGDVLVFIDNETSLQDAAPLIRELVAAARGADQSEPDLYPELRVVLTPTRLSYKEADEIYQRASSSEWTHEAPARLTSLSTDYLRGVVYIGISRLTDEDKANAASEFGDLVELFDESPSG